LVFSNILHKNLIVISNILHKKKVRNLEGELKKITKSSVRRIRTNLSKGKIGNSGGERDIGGGKRKFQKKHHKPTSRPSTITKNKRNQAARERKEAAAEKKKKLHLGRQQAHQNSLGLKTSFET
jgi:hypothetical protein